MNDMISKPNKKRIDNKRKLENALDFARFVAPVMSPAVNSSGVHAIFSLVKLYSDRITSGFAGKLIEADTPHERVNFDELFIPGFPLSLYKKEIKPEKEIVLELNSCPVIAFPWRRDRLQASLVEIGTAQNPWRLQPEHRLELWLPMGLAFVTDDGNHSICAGVLKGQGCISVSPGDKNIRVFDISPLYKAIYFDGENYLSCENNVVFCPAPSFEIGVIYEIGRLIHRSKASFLSINFKEGG